MKKTLFLTLILVFSFSAVQKISAASCDSPGLYADCVLENANSRCDHTAKSICVKKSFLDTVVNPGNAFELAGPDNNLLDSGLRAKVNPITNLFEISGATRIHLSSASGANINNENLNVKLIAAKAPRSFVAFGTTTINQVKTLYVEANRAGEGRIYANNTDIAVQDKVELYAGESIRFKNIQINNPPGEVILESGNEIKGGTAGRFYYSPTVYSPYKRVDGKIFNQPAQDYSQPVPQYGSGGNVTIKGKKIDVTDISAAGYGLGGKGGNVTIYSDYITVGNIDTSAIKGWDGAKYEPNVFGNAGKLTIKKDANNDEITFLKAEHLYLQGVVPSDLSVKASEKIRILGVDAYSGCKTGSEVKKCDYPAVLCPDPRPYREYCSEFKPSGNVELEVSGEGKDKGIWLDWKVDNSAYSDHVSNLYFYTNWNPTSKYFQGVDKKEKPASGAGNTGEISLKAEKAVVYSGEIWSQGFHSHGFLGPGLLVPAVSIIGKYLRITKIVTNNYNAKVFPQELIGTDIGTGAGDVSIVPPFPFNPSDSAFLVFDNLGGIYAQGEYPFAPNGGNVTIVSPRIESGKKLDWAPQSTTFYINTSGASLTGPGGWPFSTYEGWFLHDGYSVADSGDYIIAKWVNMPDWQDSDYDWCLADQNNRGYFDGTDGLEDGLKGGDGGNIYIEADIIGWWGALGGNNRAGFNLRADGGKGSRGAEGGQGDYCVNYNGIRNYVVPRTGIGRKGGDGGNGGDIEVRINKLHCFTDVYAQASGGIGGDGGDNAGVPYGRVWEGGNRWTGLCDLDGWKGKTVLDEKTPAQGGKGGIGGKISINPAPTDRAALLTGVSISSNGAKAGVTPEGTYYLPYPVYCTQYQKGQELVNKFEKGVKCADDAYDAYSKCKDDCYSAFYATDYLAYLDCWEACDEKEEIYAKTYIKEFANCVYGDERCCFPSWPYGRWPDYRLPYHHLYSLYDYWEELGCYPVDVFDNLCRSQVVFETPCQTAGLTYKEQIDLSRGRTISKNIVNAEQLPNTPFNGQNGSDGGSGGEIIFSSLFSASGWFSASGGSGAAGSPGQYTSIGKPGDGGNGGNGGNGGKISLGQGAVPEWCYAGGSKGREGWAGRQGLYLPKSNGFCAWAAGDKYYYWDWDKVCPREHPYEKLCCDALADELTISCRTKTPRSNDYSPITYGFKFLEDQGAKDGTEGNDGKKGSFSSIAPSLVSSADQAAGISCFNPPPIGGIPDLIVKESDCCDGIDNDGDGFTDCQDLDCNDACFNPNTGLLMRGSPNLRPELKDPLTGDLEVEPEKIVCAVNICSECHDNDKDGPIDRADSTDCKIGKINNPPTAINLTIEYQFYCEIYGGKRVGRVGFKWTYDDVDGDPETKWEIVIDDDQDIGTDPMYHYVAGAGGNLNNPSPTDNTHTIYVADFNIPEGYLNYGTSYYWGVKVYDNQGNDSGWVKYNDPTDSDKFPVPPGPAGDGISNTFTTAKHAWPKPEFKCNGQVCVSISPQPLVDELVAFTDETQFFDAVCSANPDNSECGYFWTFPDGTPATSNERNPSASFDPKGIKEVILRATDSDKYTCSVSHDLSIEAGARRPPEWKEIAPF